MLSNTCKYAVRSVIYLALNQEDEKKIGIKQISKDLDIPMPFLGKILQILAKQKLLLSTKGPHGGFSLGRDPEEISLLNVIEIIDGLDAFENCLIGMSTCKSAEENNLPCPVHDRVCEARGVMFDFFKNETIAQIIDNLEDKEGYYIL